jgi:hypothetical protein
MIADPRGIYSRPFEINVPVTDAGTINSQAIVAGNIYTITGTGTRFTSEIPSAGYVVSTGATKIRVNSVANDLQFTGTAITTGTLAGAYTAPVSPFLDLVLDKTVGYGGRTQSLRFDKYDRTDQGGSGTTGRCTDAGISRSFATNNIPHIWIEMYLKFTPGFTVIAPSAWGCTSGADQKLIHGAVSQGPGGGQDSRFGLDMEEYGWTIYAPPNDGRFPVNNAIGPSPSSVVDGNWHQVRLEWAVSSTPGAADGVWAGWIDGSSIGSYRNAVIDRGGIYAVKMLANMNQGPGALESIWFGQVKIYNTNPGW